MNSILIKHSYLAGYSGIMVPRMLRRVLAKSELHRAWLSGHLGVFWEHGIRYGPANPYGSLSA